VLNNLYKHTQLQDTFARTCRPGRRGGPHPAAGPDDPLLGRAQIEVILRRTRYLLRQAQQRAQIVSALLKAIDGSDEVIALIRGSESANAACRA